MNINKVEEKYHEILETMEKEGLSQKKVQDELMADFTEKRVLLKGNPIPSFINPVFVGPQEIEKYKRVTEVIMSSLEKVANLFYTEPSLEPLFQLREGEDVLTKVDHGYEGRIQHGRLDAFVVDGVVRFCEFNCDTPGGPGWLDLMSAALLKTPAMSKLGEQYNLSFEALMPGILDGLLACYKDWCAKKGKTPEDKPRIAVTTIPALDPTNDEIDNIGIWLRDQGYDAIVAPAKDCVYEDGKFMVKGQHVELVYRRGAGFWWLNNPEDYAGHKAAYEAGAICMVNPISSKLGGKKSLMAVLQSDKMAEHLTKEEKEFVDRHIPWTRTVAEKETKYQGEKVDLIPFLKKNRETMVLKPIGLFGGKDVVVGKDATDEEWLATIEKALKEAYVVQEFIPIPTIKLPVCTEDGIKFEEKKVNMNFYAFNGKYAGGLARVSDSNVINVCAGGGIVPIVTVEEK